MFAVLVLLVDDTDADPGQIRVTDVAIGDYTVSQTTTPDGYLPADDQSGTVAADEVARFDITNAAATGTLSIIAQDANGVAVNGICYSINGGDPVCDDDNNGDVNVDVAAGDYTVSVASVVEGFDAPENTQTATVTVGETTTMTWTLALRPGSLTIDTTELEAAMWVDRAEVHAALAGDMGASFMAPPPLAIARYLLEDWAA